MNAPEWVEKKLHPFLQGTPGATFLVVEGQDDLDVYSRCLERLALAHGKNPAAVAEQPRGTTPPRPAVAARSGDTETQSQ